MLGASCRRTHRRRPWSTTATTTAGVQWLPLGTRCIQRTALGRTHTAKTALHSAVDKSQPGAATPVMPTAWRCALLRLALCATPLQDATLLHFVPTTLIAPQCLDSTARGRTTSSWCWAKAAWCPTPSGCRTPSRGRAQCLHHHHRLRQGLEARFTARLVRKVRRVLSDETPLMAWI
jgi:hypothetical protein